MVKDKRLRTPQVFTPPRDDFAGMPGSGANTAMPHEHQQTVVTRQACCLLFRGASFFTCSLAGLSILYTVINFVVGEQKVINCLKQPVQHGIILPGPEGSKPEIICDGNYSLGAPVMDIECRMISEKCVIKKHATVMKEAVRQCDRKYAYVSKIMAQTSLASKATLKDVEVQEEDAIPHACMSNEELGLKPSALYDDDEQSPQPAQGATALQSIASVAGLALMPLALLATAVVMRGRTTAMKHGRYPAPPSVREDATLLADDEALLADDEEAPAFS